MTPQRVLTLYSKPGCHLCNELRAELDDLRAELAFDVEEVDITRDAALFEKYRYEIPVLLADGAEIGRTEVQTEVQRWFNAGATTVRSRGSGTP